jgi:hypothetical protein
LRQAGDRPTVRTGPQNGEVDLLRRLDVLELLELFQPRSASSVILPESILSPVIDSTMSPE